jgi:hypothetical protein
LYCIAQIGQGKQALWLLLAKSRKFYKKTLSM